MPALITNRYFANDQSVFVYENPTFLPDQGRRGVSRHVDIPSGAFVSTAAGSFLRCTAGIQNDYNVDLATGTLSAAINQTAIWSQHWKLLDCLENIIYLQ